MITKLVNVTPGNVAKVNINSNMTLHISSKAQQKQLAHLIIYTPIRLSTEPDGYTNIFSFYLNVSNIDNLSINVTIEYNCTQNPVPFFFANDSWHQIYNVVLLQNPCRATFSAPNRHDIGLFVLQAPAVSTATTTISQNSSQLTGYYEAGGAVIAMLAVIVIAYLIRIKIKK